MPYRRDIDGLRAVAVILVIGFHSFPAAFPGGYIGVDVFFVISGFLITGLVLQELRDKEFSFRSFYFRRIKRIFPALAVVLAVCFPIGWILLLPREFQSLGLNIFGGAAFSSNLVLLAQSGYFDISAVQKPLLHLWSLGVEEQFYIVWPIFLLWAFVRRLNILTLAATILVVSFILNVARAGTSEDFYLPFTRAWELMIGGMLAARLSELKDANSHRAPSPMIPSTTARANVLAMVGFSLIAVSVIFLNLHSEFPGWWAILPTVGAALVILANGSWLNDKILSNPRVVFIGLISYPLYLWHWPLLSFARILEPDLSRQLRITAIVIAAAAAWITYQYIEKPIRKGSVGPSKVMGLCAAMMMVGAIGLGTFYWNGFPWRLPPLVREEASVMPDLPAAWRLHKCFLETDDTKFASECIGGGDGPLVFLWGDSLAAALYPGLKQLQQNLHFGLAQYNEAGCLPVLSFAAPGRPHCAEDNAISFAEITRVQPDILLLDSAWAWDYGKLDYGEELELIPQLADLLAKLRSLKHTRVVIMGPLPEWVGGLPEAVFDYWRTHKHELIPRHSSFRVDRSWLAYEQRLQNQVRSLGTEYISAWDALCNGATCLTRLGDEPKDIMAFDAVHLTLTGSNYLAQAIAACLFPSTAPRIAGVDLSLVCPASVRSQDGDPSGPRSSP